jgi:urea carboxylase
VPTDALSPHVTLADEAVALFTSDLPSESGSQPYINGPSIIAIAKAHSATLLHPGYGFLSENSEFASLVVNAGISWLGPRPSVIKLMGIKTEARKVAVEAGLPVIPGSSLLTASEDALTVAKKVGFPVILKATAGGGGMGMAICANVAELRERFKPTSDRAKVC